MINFRGGGLRNFRGGGLRNFPGGGMRNFRGRGLSREGLNFFGRGDIFSGGVGNFLGAGLRFFGCGWDRLIFFQKLKVSHGIKIFVVT